MPLEGNTSFLKIAQENGWISETATDEDLTLEARQKVIDFTLLQDAITNGLLPKSAKIEDLTLSVRQKIFIDKEPLNENDLQRERKKYNDTLGKTYINFTKTSSKSFF